MTAGEPETILGRLRDLPVLPQALTDLLIALQRESVAIDQLVEAISHDQALVAKTLKLASAAASPHAIVGGST